MSELVQVVNTVKLICIRKVIENWLEDKHSEAYPEVCELYKIHANDTTW